MANPPSHPQDPDRPHLQDFIPKKQHRCAEKFHLSQLGKKGSGWHAGESPGTPNCWKATASSSTLSAFNARNAFSAAYAGMAEDGWQMQVHRCTLHSRHLIKAPKSFTKKAWSFLQVIYLVKCQSHHASQSLQLLPVEVSMEHATFKNLTSSQRSRNTPKTNEYICSPPPHDPPQWWSIVDTKWAVL